MAFLIGGANSAADTGFDVANSCRFDGRLAGEGGYLSKTSGGDGTATSGTFSCWVKIGNLIQTNTIMSQVEDGSNFMILRFNSSFALDLRWRDTGSGTDANLTTTRLFRDTAAWYNIVVKFLTSDGTAGNRVKIYINGVQETSFSSSEYPTQNDALFGNVTSGVYRIGDNGFAAEAEDFDGYIAEVVWLDGTSTTASDFGEFDEDSPQIWKPKDVSGLTFGTNGFYLDFEASGNLGNDANGGTDLDETNLDATDQATDTPTNSFCTLNVNDLIGGPTITQGAVVMKSHDSDRGGRATMAVKTGKWYFEAKVVYQEGSGDDDGYIGIQDSDGELKLGVDIISDTGQSSVIYEFLSGDLRKNGGDVGTDYAAAVNSIFGFKLDLDNGNLYIHDDGTYLNSGSAVVTSITSGVFYMPFFGVESDGGKSQWQTNFGGSSGFTISSATSDENGYGTFEHTVPDGYLALCTKNLGSDGG